MADKQPVAIVFDTFGTVVDWRSSLITELRVRPPARHQRRLDCPGRCLAGGLSPVDGSRAEGRAAVDHPGWATPRVTDKLVAEFSIRGLTEGICDTSTAPGIGSIPGRISCQA